MNMREAPPPPPPSLYYFSCSFFFFFTVFSFLLAFLGFYFSITALSKQPIKSNQITSLVLLLPICSHDEKKKTEKRTDKKKEDTHTSTPERCSGFSAISSASMVRSLVTTVSRSTEIDGGERLCWGELMSRTCWGSAVQTTSGVTRTDKPTRASDGVQSLHRLSTTWATGGKQTNK